jgi:hypothetical protein
MGKKFKLILEKEVYQRKRKVSKFKYWCAIIKCLNVLYSKLILKGKSLKNQQAKPPEGKVNQSKVKQISNAWDLT